MDTKDLTYLLEYIGNGDAEAIDCDDYEFLGETESGLSGTYTHAITDLCHKAAEAIKALSQQAEQEPLRYTGDKELAECPCCGSLDVGGVGGSTSIQEGIAYVNCYACGLELKRKGTLAEACAAWNRRTRPPAAAEQEPYAICCERCGVLKFGAPRQCPGGADHDFSTHQPALPEGWQLVPIEPTPKMFKEYADHSIAPISTLSRHGYKAMIAAAPEAPNE